MKKNILILVCVIVLLVLAGGSFYGGMLYQKSTRSFPGVNFQGQGMPSGSGLGANNVKQNGGMNIGEIISKDTSSITIKLINGGSKIVFYSNETEITKSAKATSDDLTVGKNISVQGTSNSDGSVTAKTIQLK